MKKLNKDLISIHIAVLLFGTAGLFGKFLDLSPVWIVFGRVAFASLFLALYMILTHPFAKKKTIEETGYSSLPYTIFLMIALGFILTVHWLTFFHSIQVSTVAIGLLSFSTFPIFVVFLEPILLKGTFKIRYLFFALFTLFGVILLIPEFRWINSYFQGVVWGCISGALFALLTIINKYLAAKYSAINIAFWQNFISFLILFVIIIVWFNNQAISFTEWMILLLLGVLFTALSHTLFIFGLKSVKARVAGIIACMEPVYGIIFAYILLSEIPQTRMLMGGIIIIGTTIYLTLKEK